MKFEFNSRTGTMEPKKNEQIYFARAMSGGLRIDDNKNNIIYIIERNGDLKIVSGTRMKHMNIYDNRDAHIIAERVKRMFGVSHPYADYKKFMRGFRTSESQVKKFEDFVTEGMWGSALKRSNTGEDRREDKFNPDFVDLGEHTSVYWTTENLVLDGNDTFTWDEIYNYNKTGWRLPTRKELKEVNWKESRVRWKDGEKNIMIGDKILKINDHTYKYLGQRIAIWSKTEETRFKTSAYYLSVTGVDYNIDTANKHNRLFVFLVKDKK